MRTLALWELLRRRKIGEYLENAQSRVGVTAAVDAEKMKQDGRGMLQMRNNDTSKQAGVGRRAAR